MGAIVTKRIKVWMKPEREDQESLKELPSREARPEKATVHHPFLP